MKLSRMILVIISVLAGIPLQAASFQLPPSQSLFSSLMPATATCLSGDSVDVGAAAYGNMNLDSLWTYNNMHQPAMQFSAPRACAQLADGAWVQVTRRRWQFSAGAGLRDEYQGNQDAGQLWLDLHTDNPVLRNYAPVISASQCNVSWLGLGYRLPFSSGSVQGSGMLRARYLQAYDLLLGSATGQVSGTNYTGMAGIISSAGEAPGNGWAMDIQTKFDIGSRWSGECDVDGLCGQLSWKRVYVDDTYLVSPSIYTDPNGFLHNFWEATGEEWQRSLTVNITPTIVSQLTYHGHPDLATMLYTDANGTTPTFIIGWRWPHAWNTLCGYAPTVHCYLLGIDSPCCGVDVSVDDLGASTQQLSVSVHTRVLAF
jgi:hypothetical protein